MLTHIGKSTQQQNEFKAGLHNRSCFEDFRPALGVTLMIKSACTALKVPEQKHIRTRWIRNAAAFESTTWSTTQVNLVFDNAVL